jgi:cytochrome c-type biogenesis protein CcmH/NrfF
LWFAPLALCGAGAIAVARIVRRRVRQAVADAQSTNNRSNDLRSGDDDW